MKKKYAIIFLVVNTIYLALIYYVLGTLYPASEGLRFLIAFLFCCICPAPFILLGISLGAYDD
jgi:hypothetical protein